MDLSIVEIRKQIYSVRGYQVMLDSDLAALFQTKTKVLNQTVRRNLTRFPEDFSFQINEGEYQALNPSSTTMKEGKGHHRKYLPRVFTVHGVGMLSSFLNSDRALQVNFAVVRAYGQLPHSSENSTNLEIRINSLEGRISRIEDNNNRYVGLVIDAIDKLTLLRDTSSSVLTKTEEKVFPGPSAEIEKVQQSVANYFKLRVRDLVIASRIKTITFPRQIAMYLSREVIKAGYRDIGMAFGGRDHTTALHAHRKIAAQVRENENIRNIVSALERTLDA